MKILQYTDNYSHIGGVESYFLEIPKYLRRNGHKIYAFSFSKIPFFDKYNFIYKKKDKNLIKRFISGFVFDFKVYNLLRKKLTEIKPDIVHLNHNQDYTYSILLAIKRSKIPVIQTIHDYSILCPNLYYNPSEKRCENATLGMKCVTKGCFPLHYYIGFLLTYSLKRFIIKKSVNYFISPSKTLKKHLEENRFKKVMYLPHFVDLKKWKFKSKRSANYKILFVGRFSKPKGIHVLIKATAIVAKQFPETKLTIIGEGEDKDYIENLIKSLKIKKNIEFIGGIPNERLMNYYHKTNVFVMPSLLMEQFGIGGIEALACGTPCIGSNIGGIPEWCINNKTGFLFKPGDYKELAEKIIELFKNKKIANDLALNGRRLVEKNHSVNEHIENLENIYKSVIKLYNK